MEKEAFLRLPEAKRELLLKKGKEAYVRYPFEDITIRFNRPVTIYTWFHLGITLRRDEALPPNYVDLLRNVILEKMAAIDAGKDVIPQEEFMADLYRACSGISYIDIRMFTSEDSAAKPDEYTDRTATITARQRAYTSEDMIEVEIDG